MPDPEIFRAVRPGPAAALCPNQIKMPNVLQLSKQFNSCIAGILLNNFPKLMMIDFYQRI
jgi:hypothetical protein